ncbi:m7GpppN-mRNA hydrolase [Orchesella cincta]|uniref:mRNA-decapping enzyme 2 n=1 Tax=Orchesella cincta TaxID=48709 RepID=A0A1D2NFN0_ORCCI|nr:m7GpppN-mRNA hydrolase [Orchesella cincta]
MDSHGGGHGPNLVNIKTMVFDPKFAIPDDIVDDVICRFLLNIPKEEKFDPIRVCFQIELAHWFFVDFYCGEGCSPVLATLHSIPYNQFAFIMFTKTPHLRKRLPEIDKHLASFREYKMKVPTYGAILMNESLTKVVLVQGFRNQWGFPKGKVNEIEEPVSCAIREVFEETGYDIAPLVNNNHFIESKALERNDRLYLVRGVDPKFPFHPQTQFEIKNIQWFNIDELPEHKRDGNPAVSRHGVPISNFYTVYPYVKRLRSWISDKLEGKNKIQHFKIREIDNSEGQAHSSNQRNSNKSSHHSLIQQQQQFSKGHKNQNNTFQFQQQFLPGATGWQMFPQPLGPSEPTSFSVNSNALHELILSQSQLQIQNRPNQGTTKGGSKNPRRRLFSEEQAGNGKQHSKDANSKRASDTHSAVTILNPQPAPIKKPGSKTKAAKAPAKYQLSAPSWVHFTFDRERVYKAFFTPSL